MDDYLIFQLQVLAFVIVTIIFSAFLKWACERLYNFLKQHGRNILYTISGVVVLCLICLVGYQIYIHWETVLAILKIVAIIILVVGAIFTVLVIIGCFVDGDGDCDVDDEGYIPKYITPSPIDLYHGTSRQNAIEICNTNLWLINKPIIDGVYLTSDFERAQTYAGFDGAIVVVRVDSGMGYEKEGENIFIFPIPDAKRKMKEYYHIIGLTPVAILDYYGNKLF